MATGRIPTTANSPLTAKGDLFTFSTGSAKLAVGNDGETLVADSSTSTGLRYQPSQAAGKNNIINGAFDIWQRGTSGTANSSSAGAGYNADRWQNRFETGALTVSRQATSDTTNLPNIQYCARVQRNSGNTVTNPIYHVQTIETSNTIPRVGQTVILSFYARKGANYSAASSQLYALLDGGTGTDQNIFGFTGYASLINSAVTLTATWQRFTASVTVTSTLTELGVGFSYTPVGTAGANDYFEVTGVQLELGSVATTFSRAGGTIQGELAACMRYAEKVEYTSSTVLAVGQAYSTSAAWGGIFWTTQKRATPTITQTGTVQALQANTGSSGTTFTYSTIGTNNARMDHSGGSGLVAGNASIFQASGAVSLLITAEL